MSGVKQVLWCVTGHTLGSISASCWDVIVLLGCCVGAPYAGMCIVCVCAYLRVCCPCVSVVASSVLVSCCVKSIGVCLCQTQHVCTFDSATHGSANQQPSPDCWQHSLVSLGLPTYLYIMIDPLHWCEASLSLTAISQWTEKDHSAEEERDRRR